eukprot:CAMPEP_0194334206 /NCGR_PEP_ID=MMETSP0171-20130528/65358_1 /TAXON_ID=218684 /ORGANISM="Corethron pennatum, Strain L29A3" /LENGTH=173 /DNA_ID=CAMNT_0039096773 /DNA_START=25 /DNA_END=546 /DNA_ORIENTATION=-
MKLPSTAKIFLVAFSMLEGVTGLLAVNRRTFWKNLGAAGAAAVTFAPRSAEAAFDPYTFNHQYDDPKHPNCKRIVVVKKDGVAMVSGTVGKPACPEDGDPEVWRLTGEAEGEALAIDFSEAGGPEDMKGKWDGDGIQWSDGNKWYIKGMLPKPKEPEAPDAETPKSEAAPISS